MRSLVKEKELFSHDQSNNRGTMNVFTCIKAATELAHDLLQARQIGEQHYKNHVTHHILCSLAPFFDLLYLLLCSQDYGLKLNLSG